MQATLGDRADLDGAYRDSACRGPLRGALVEVTHCGYVCGRCSLRQLADRIDLRDKITGLTSIDTLHFKLGNAATFPRFNHAVANADSLDAGWRKDRVDQCA